MISILILVPLVNGLRNASYRSLVRRLWSKDFGAKIPKGGRRGSGWISTAVAQLTAGRKSAPGPHLRTGSPPEERSGPSSSRSPQPLLEPTVWPGLPDNLPRLGPESAPAQKTARTRCLTLC